ncbi:DUF4352 domain-containing protein [bacterium]|nr:MAG: DUF4352 domain-containing protein [bacterium]
MNFTRQFALIALFATGSSFVHAIPKKTALKAKTAAPKAAPAKPTPRLIREVMGTTQLVGYEGGLGQTFTLGKDMPFNFTLKSAEYTVNRLNVGTQTIFPKGDEKLLVLHFTAHNPTAKSFHFSSNYLSFIAIDSSGVTRKYINELAREVTSESVGLQLNPGQKIDAYTIIRVAAFGAVPKLIVGHIYETKAPIIRYDLRSIAKKLVAPYADPTDNSGATALKLVAAKTGVFYPVSDPFDARLEKIEYSTEKMGGREPGTGQKYCFATFTIRNGSKKSVNASYSYFRADLKDADGEKTAYTTSMLKASRDEESSTQLAPGEEIRVRFYWPIPENVTAKTVLLQYGYDREARTFAFANPN